MIWAVRVARMVRNEKYLKTLVGMWREAVLHNLYQFNKKWPLLMETAGALSSQQPLATTLYAEPQGYISFYNLTLLDTQWYNIQLKHRAWSVLYMQAIMNTLYEIAGHIKSGHLLIRCVTISSPRRTLDLVRHVDGERERERERECVCVCIYRAWYFCHNFQSILNVRL